MIQKDHHSNAVEEGASVDFVSKQQRQGVAQDREVLVFLVEEVGAQNAHEEERHHLLGEGAPTFRDVLQRSHDLLVGETVVVEGGGEKSQQVVRVAGHAGVRRNGVLRRAEILRAVRVEPEDALVERNGVGRAEMEIGEQLGSALERDRLVVDATR